MRSSHRTLARVVAASALIWATPLWGDNVILNFTVGSDNIYAVVALDAPKLADGYFAITGLRGTAGGQTISLAAPGISHAGGSTDNEFNPLGSLTGMPTPFVNANGFGYTEKDGDSYAFFWHQNTDDSGGQYEGCWMKDGGCAPGGTIFVVENFDVTPEPSALWILCAGIVMVLALRLRRRRVDRTAFSARQH